MKEHFFGSCHPHEAWPLIRDFHYSRRMPGNVQHCFVLRKSGGLFGEHGEIVAACLWGSPPTRWGEPVLELTRLVRHENEPTPLSALIGASTRWLKRTTADLLVSFADKTQGHHGGIYQSASWNYAGARERRMDGVLIDGVFWPGRSCNARFGTQSPVKLQTILKNREVAPHFDEGKHLYWKALNRHGDARARRLGLSANAYPKPQRDLSSGRPAPSGASRVQTPEVAPL